MKRLRKFDWRYWGEMILEGFPYMLVAVCFVMAAKGGW